MKADFADKAEARRAVWDRLQAERLARFPFPPHGRIPNFAGAKEAAERLFEVEPWRSARRIKVNPDAPQRPVRAAALRRGITVFVPTPRLRAGFKKLDPARIPHDQIRAAASLSRGARFAEDVPLEALPAMDAIVCGSVAVTRDGRRCGKGEGYSDLEYAILRELGHPAGAGRDHRAPGADLPPAAARSHGPAALADRHAGRGDPGGPRRPRRLPASTGRACPRRIWTPCRCCGSWPGPWVAAEEVTAEALRRVGACACRRRSTPPSPTVGAASAATWLDVSREQELPGAPQAPGHWR